MRRQKSRKAGAHATLFAPPPTVSDVTMAMSVPRSGASNRTQVRSFLGDRTSARIVGQRVVQTHESQEPSIQGVDSPSRSQRIDGSAGRGRIHWSAEEILAILDDMKSPMIAVGLVLGVAGPSGFAVASLGDEESSVQVDREKMSAQVHVQATQQYAVHEMQLATGTRVREFVSPAGKVFGVAWAGPFMPDLKQILGKYFDQYAAALKTRPIRRGPLAIRGPGLVVDTGGHMRAWAGRAYVPELVPARMQVDEIR
jgi:hypothetical protein